MLDRTDLIHAAQTGDAASIGRLLAVCQADARRYARQHCQASDIDDAVQESLLVISRKVHGLKAAAAFSSWLFTVIRRECRRLERLMLRHEPLDDELAEHRAGRRAAMRRCASTWPMRSSRCRRTTSRSCCCATSRS